MELKEGEQYSHPASDKPAGIFRREISMKNFILILLAIGGVIWIFQKADFNQIKKIPDLLENPKQTVIKETPTPIPAPPTLKEKNNSTPLPEVTTLKKSPKVNEGANNDDFDKEYFNGNDVEKISPPVDFSGENDKALQLYEEYENEKTTNTKGEQS